VAEVIVTGTVGLRGYSGEALQFPLLERVGRGEQQRDVRWDCVALGSTAVLLDRGVESGMTVKLSGRLELMAEVVAGEVLLRRKVWVTGVLSVSGHSAGKTTTQGA
jgi:hypothetical protein